MGATNRQSTSAVKTKGIGPVAQRTKPIEPVAQ